MTTQTKIGNVVYMHHLRQRCADSDIQASAICIRMLMRPHMTNIWLRALRLMAETSVGHKHH